MAKWREGEGVWISMIYADIGEQSGVALCELSTPYIPSVALYSMLLHASIVSTVPLFLHPVIHPLNLGLA